MREVNLIIVLLLLVVSSCNKTEKEVQQPVQEIAMKYAKGFRMESSSEYTKLTVETPFKEAEKGFSYYLVSRDKEIPPEIQNEVVIRTPIQAIVCTSTTHIPLLEYLDELATLKGFPNTDYISSARVRELVNLGEIADLGVEKGINMELLLSAQPEIVMGYMVTSDKGQLEKIEQLGIPVVINAEYLEEHPLGRAEWIKFAAAFFDKQQEADSIFSFIEDRYIEASTRGKSSDTTPSVLSGVVYGDTWFLPGGQNYASKMIADAGGSYLWADDTTKGFLELGFESVYQKAVNADFWLGVASYTSLEDLKQGDDRYAMLAPYKNKKVFSYNKRIGSEGGNEYFELGYLRPDIILNDLVSILHPNLQQEPLFFFMPLE